MPECKIESEKYLEDYGLPEKLNIFISEDSGGDVFIIGDPQLKGTHNAFLACTGSEVFGDFSKVVIESMITAYNASGIPHQIHIVYPDGNTEFVLQRLIRGPHDAAAMCQYVKSIRTLPGGAKWATFAEGHPNFLTVLDDEVEDQEK